MATTHNLYKSDGYQFMSSHQLPRLLNAKELAGILGISERELWRRRSSGRLPEVIALGPKTLRWSLTEITSWIEAGCPDQKK